jgi:hypothetical protein
MRLTRNFLEVRDFPRRHLRRLPHLHLKFRTMKRNPSLR